MSKPELNHSSPAARLWFRLSFVFMSVRHRRQRMMADEMSSEQSPQLEQKHNVGWTPTKATGIL